MKDKDTPEQISGQVSEHQAEKPVETPDAAAEPKGQTEQKAAEPNSEVAELQRQLEEKEAALQDMSNKYLRLAAEYDNYRRRSQKEKEALYTETIAEVVSQWLPVLDNLDRAEFLSASYESDEARKVCEGIVMIQKQVKTVLDQLSVSEIESQDQPFDPQLHDAVMHVEDDQAGPSTVVEVLRKGYKVNDRVIRHVMVKVAN